MGVVSVSGASCRRMEGKAIADEHALGRNEYSLGKMTI